MLNVSPATWSALSQLLDEALSLEPAARAEWLAQLATTQPQLAPTLQRLLAAETSSETADILARVAEAGIAIEGVPRNSACCWRSGWTVSTEA